MLLNKKIEEIFHRWKWAENADDLISEISTGTMGDPILTLANYLNHSDEHFQTYAIAIMMKLDSDRSMAYAENLIQDADWQFHICELIFRYGGTKELLPHVIDILKNSEHVGTRVMAAIALRTIGDENSIAVLQQVAKHDHELDSGGWSVNLVAEETILEIQSRQNDE